MVGDRYRTRQETIDYFMQLAHDYEVEGHRADNDKERWRAFGKAEAYVNAAFEIEHNLERGN